MKSTNIGKPKYNLGDKVRFQTERSENLTGIIRIVDSHGTFEQKEEPSYDIFVIIDGDDPGCLYKHIRESMVYEILETNKDSDSIKVSQQDMLDLLHGKKNWSDL